MNIREILRKALTIIRLPRQGGLTWGFLPRTQYDYAAEVGDGRQSSIIMACVKWIQRTFPEAPVMLLRRDAEGQWEQVHEHPLLELLDTPNPFYDGLLLQAATVADLTLSGNAYWIKVRSRAGRPVQLWWIPSTMIEPKWPLGESGSSVFISHYEYTPGGEIIKLDPKDVVHFRDGLDPKNIRKGLSPLQSLFREIFTDDEAANMTASLLRNLGVPGLVVSPEGIANVSQQDAEAVKEWFRENFTGDRRGEPLVMGAATKVQSFGFSPQQMSLKDLRRIPEERISAVLGVPAIVAGLGAGLDRSTFANYEEAREAAYESNIIPTQRLTAAVIKRQLLSEYEDDLSMWRVAYDLSQVRVLQEDENRLVERVNMMVHGGYLKIVDAQRMTGAPVDETQDFYLRPLNLLQVPSGTKSAEPQKSLALKYTLSEEHKEAIWKSYVRETEQHELMFRRVLKGLFQEQQAEVIRRLKEHGTLEGAMFNEAASNEKFAKAFEPAIEMVFKKAYLGAQGLVNPQNPHKADGGHEFKQDEGLLSAAALEWIKTRSLMLAKMVNGTTRDELRAVLAEGFEAGESIFKITKRIKQYYQNGYERRAPIVARTEVIAASAQGAIEGYKDAGVQKVEWYTALDERTCPLCEPLHGKIYPINEAEMPPLHPQCRCVLISVLSD